jgi:hypothetical protein
MNSDDQLRALLEDAVADVRPRSGLDSIRSRTTGSSHRAWGWSAGAAVLATAATIAVVAVLGGLGGVSGTTDAGPGPAGSTAPTAESPTETVYFVGQTGAGPRLFPEMHRVSSTGAALDESLDAAVGGRADDPDYASSWPAGTTMQRAQLEHGVLSVDLGGPVVGRPAGTTRTQAALALQQLVYTAQDVARSRIPVTFLHDGRPTATLLGEPTVQPVAAGSADDVLAPVQVASPSDGSTVRSPFTVTGKAAAFEANVQWELTRGSAVAKRGFTTARECCTLAPYSFRVEAPPGEYTLVVHDEDASGGEGNPPAQDTKRVTVR